MEGKDDQAGVPAQEQGGGGDGTDASMNVLETYLQNFNEELSAPAPGANTNQQAEGTWYTCDDVTIACLTTFN